MKYTKKEAKFFEKMARTLAEIQQEKENMPKWVKNDMLINGMEVGTRVSVASKIAHDNLDVEAWISKKSSRKMYRVHWSDGTTTMYDGDLSKNYVNWDR